MYFFIITFFSAFILSFTRSITAFTFALVCISFDFLPLLLLPNTLTDFYPDLPFFGPLSFFLCVTTIYFVFESRVFFFFVFYLILFVLLSAWFYVGSLTGFLVASYLISGNSQLDLVFFSSIF